MDKSIFHVHTHRCNHATYEEDYLYIEKAIEVGAKSICFTDHAPFPGNPFGNRMAYEELPEYVHTLAKLKKDYSKYINVYMGLEIEYLPSYYEYYKQLKASNNFNVLMIGQHFYEITKDKYSFSENEDVLKDSEATGCAQAIVSGIRTGFFNVVAHPDRIFRRRQEWGDSETIISNQIISNARAFNVKLEQNASSKKQANYYRNEFWKNVPDELIIKGLDAHSTREIVKNW